MLTLDILTPILLTIILAGAALLVRVYREKREVEKELARLERERDEEEKLLRVCREDVAHTDADADEATRETQALSEFNRRRREERERRKEEVLEKLSAQGEIQTGDVADMFEVSRGTAFNYLSELVEEGRIRQVGESGRNVRYELVK